MRKRSPGCAIWSRPSGALPWAKVDKQYVFDTPEGKKTLAELFGNNSQLVIHHFMFAPDWDAGCPSCSLEADQPRARSRIWSITT
jgi:predicted dithiol-disulfide oxidoreductase (DUF899 family)